MHRKAYSRLTHRLISLFAEQVRHRVEFKRKIENKGGFNGSLLNDEIKKFFLEQFKIFYDFKMSNFLNLG